MDDHQSILTQNPEEEIWYYIGKLTSRHHVKKVLKARVIRSEIVDFVKTVNTKKMEYNNGKQLINTNGSSKTGQHLEIYNLLSDEELNSNTEQICVIAKQAIELYKASRDLSIYAKPITLYYCYTRLARILFLSTFSTNSIPQKGTKSHGLSFQEPNIKCQSVGAFPRFQDSFSQDPTIYMNGSMFDWKCLINCLATQRYYLFENMRKQNIVTVKDKKNNQTYQMHELTRELLFTYAMSMIARYEIINWKKIIESEDSDIIWNIEGYLKSTQSFFPNLVLNELHGKKFFFYSEMRSSPDTPEFDI